MKTGENVVVYDELGNYLFLGMLKTILDTEYTDYRYGIKIEDDPSLIFVRLENIKQEVENA